MNSFTITEINRQILSGEKTLYEISEYLPCYLHINSLNDFSVLEADSTIQNYFDLDISEINKQGFSLLEKHVDSNDLANAIMLNQEYLKKQDEKNHVSFIQRINFPKIKKDSFFYTRGKILDENRILNLSISIEELKLFNHRFFNLFESASFIKRNIPKYDSLTKRELFICKYLIRESSLNDIARILNISAHTVKNHKINIYKKIGVNNYFDFYYFCSKFKIDE